jgi:hypothetical protein
MSTLDNSLQYITWIIKLLYYNYILLIYFIAISNEWNAGEILSVPRGTKFSIWVAPNVWIVEKRLKQFDNSNTFWANMAYAFRNFKMKRRWTFLPYLGKGTTPYLILFSSYILPGELCWLPSYNVDSVETTVITSWFRWNNVYFVKTALISLKKLWFSWNHVYFIGKCCFRWNNVDFVDKTLISLKLRWFRWNYVDFVETTLISLEQRWLRRDSVNFVKTELTSLK